MKKFSKGRFVQVEILQIDTSESRKLFRDISPIDKATAAKLLKANFTECCGRHGGIPNRHRWNGDGGFAVFRSTTADEIGSSISAAEQILERLPSLNAQTARAIGLNEQFCRNLRISAHRGELFVTEDRDIDSASPDAFDDFLKFEKRFAPHPNEIFVTEPLCNKLDKTLRGGFEPFGKISAGSIKVRLYRRRRQPRPHARDIFHRGDKVQTITEADWRYLRDQIQWHFQHVAARSYITKGIIAYLGEHSQSGGIPARLVHDLTMTALYSHLCEIASTCKIRVTYWRLSPDGRKLEKVDGIYPEGEQADMNRRTLLVSDQRYMACQAVRRGEPVVTPSVVSARLNGTWVDLKRIVSRKKRGLASAIQIPIYWERKDLSRDVRGILSLDSDKFDLFLQEEIGLWNEVLGGFLVNLALAERLRTLEQKHN